MDSTAWYTWDDMTLWRFAILGAVVLVTLVVIKLGARYGVGELDDEFFEVSKREQARSDEFRFYFSSRDD